MGRPRDNQRQKVYNAESASGIQDSRLPNAPSVAKTQVSDIEAYIEHIICSAWFQRRWPEVRGHEVRDGRGHRRATGTFISYSMGVVGRAGHAQLTFPRWARTEEIVLHELAHACVEGGYGNNRVPWHGWQFCSILLELVRHQMGDDAWRDLKAAFVKGKVRHTKPRSQKARQPMTDEQKAEMAERLARGRETAARNREAKRREDIEILAREEALA